MDEGRHRWRAVALAWSAIVAGLMALASVLGLLYPSLYRDNLLVSAGWLGNDLVTLIVATPALVVAMARARRGSLRGVLVWLGLLDYALYNYAFYLFGAAFNAAFLLYVAIVTASTFALVLGVASLDAPEVARHAGHRAPRAVAAFLLLLSLGLGGFHAAVAVSFVLTGETPGLLTTIGHPTNVIAALDLWLVVSLSVVAARWLWRRQPWGLVLAAVLTVKGAFYMLALSVATLSAARSGALGNLDQLWLWGSLGAGCAWAALVLLVPISPPVRRAD